MASFDKRTYDSVFESAVRSDAPSVVFIIDTLLRAAHESRASDLHLNPGRDVLTARIRVDGKLRELYSFPLYLHAEMLARIKILSGLRTDEHQTPQDGRFRFEAHSADASPTSIDIRVSIIPTYYGENAILRLLSAHESLTSLESLGFQSSHRKVISRILTEQHGLILITGPTGSGKTSTLYVLLRLLNQEDRSLVTIEDPVEYSLEGITQIEASRNGALTFTEGLRSILRQDPDVIGIGEIRDAETAALAVHAALTGHLVLSTIHTIDAPTTIPRLVELGIEPYLIASTLKLIISQRLVTQTGTVGRTGSFEIVVVTDELRESIAAHTRVKNGYA